MRRAPFVSSPPPTCGRFGSGGALACRRSTTALAAANERYSSTPDTRFLGLGRAARSQRFEQPGSKNRALFSGRYPLLPVPVQRASRRPVFMPAGRIPRSRPGAEVTSPRPREPLSLRQPVSPAGVLYMKRDWCFVTDMGTHVKRRLAIRDAFKPSYAGLTRVSMLTIGRLASEIKCSVTVIHVIHGGAAALVLGGLGGGLAGHFCTIPYRAPGIDPVRNVEACAIAKRIAPLWAVIGGSRSADPPYGLVA